MRRVLFSGSRSFNEIDKILEVFSKLKWNDIIVHGGCPNGLDWHANNVAKENEFQTEVHKAEWDRYGRIAGFVRNQYMIDTRPDFAYFFWDGASKGTEHCLERCLVAGIPHEVIASKNMTHIVEARHNALKPTQGTLFV